MNQQTEQWAAAKVKRVTTPKLDIAGPRPLGKSLIAARLALQQALVGKVIATQRGRVWVKLDVPFLIWLVDSLEGKYG